MPGHQLDYARDSRTLTQIGPVIVAAAMISAGLRPPDRRSPATRRCTEPTTQSTSGEHGTAANTGRSPPSTTAGTGPTVRNDRGSVAAVRRADRPLSLPARSPRGLARTLRHTPSPWWVRPQRNLPLSRWFPLDRCGRSAFLPRRRPGSCSTPAALPILGGYNSSASSPAVTRSWPPGTTKRTGPALRVRLSHRSRSQLHASEAEHWPAHSGRARHARNVKILPWQGRMRMSARLAMFRRVASVATVPVPYVAAAPAAGPASERCTGPGRQN